MFYLPSLPQQLFLLYSPNDQGFQTSHRSLCALGRTAKLLVVFHTCCRGLGPALRREAAHQLPLGGHSRSVKDEAPGKQHRSSQHLRDETLHVTAGTALPHHPLDPPVGCPRHEAHPARLPPAPGAKPALRAGPPRAQSPRAAHAGTTAPVRAQSSHRLPPACPGRGPTHRRRQRSGRGLRHPGAATAAAAIARAPLRSVSARPPNAADAGGSGSDATEWRPRRAPGRQRGGPALPGWWRGAAVPVATPFPPPLPLPMAESLRCLAEGARRRRRPPGEERREAPGFGSCRTRHRLKTAAAPARTRSEGPAGVSAGVEAGPSRWAGGGCPVGVPR